MKHEVIYSIIIPHKNDPILLENCINSIPDRDDIQIIIIDDKSDSTIVDFDNFPRQKRTNLELHFTHESKGAGFARNIGLQYAKGEWILFADSDDFYTINAFEILDKYTNSPVDYICFCVNSININTNENGKRSITSDSSVREYLKAKTFKSENLFKFKNFACWNKMYSHSFIKTNEILFEESIVNNDVYFSFQVALFAQNFIVIPNELYCCTYSSKSLTFQKRSIKRQFLFYLQAKKRNGFYKKIGLNSSFIRYDWIFLPYIILKRGIIGAIQFYSYSWKHRKELKNAKNAYLSLFDKL